MKHLIRNRAIGMAVALVLAGTSTAQNPASMPKSPNEPAGTPEATVPTGSIPDTGFYQQALAGGVQEILLSQQAAIRANSAEVRSLASMLASEHLALDRQLSETGKATIPSPTAADRKQDADLQRASGALFDTTYLAAMEQAHQKAIALFNDTMLHAHDSATRDVATTALQSLRRHLTEIQLQQRRVSGG